MEISSVGENVLFAKAPLHGSALLGSWLAGSSTILNCRLSSSLSWSSLPDSGEVCEDAIACYSANHADGISSTAIFLAKNQPDDFS